MLSIDRFDVLMIFNSCDTVTEVWFVDEMIDDEQGETQEPAPAISLDKTNDGAAPLGGTITYTYTVSNTGNTTLTAVTVVDDPLGPIAIGDTAGNGVDVLEPGDIETGAATHTVTPTDINNGVVVNEATAEGTAPDGTTVSDSVTHTVVLQPPPAPPPPPPTASLTISKVTAPTGGTGFGFTDNVLPDQTGGAFPLSDGESRVFTNVTPGDFTVTETELPVGWTLTNIACTCLSPSTSTPSRRSQRRQRPRRASPRPSPVRTMRARVGPSESTRPLALRSPWISLRPPLLAPTSSAPSPMAPRLWSAPVRCWFPSLTVAASDLSVGTDTTFGVAVGSLNGPQNVLFAPSDTPTVAETAATAGRTSTDLADYVSTVTCNDRNQVMTGLPSGTTSVVLPPLQVGADIECVFTNTRNGAPTLAVRKVVINGVGGEQFDFELDGVAFIDDLGDGETQPSPGRLVSQGMHTLMEFAAAGGPLSNFTTSISCRDGGGTGASVGIDPTAGASITLDLTDPSFAGADILCTFTNTLAQSPTLAVAVIAAGGDLFDFELDGVPFLDDLGNGETQPAPGASVAFSTHTLTEFDTAGGPLMGFATSISCRLGGGTGASVGTDPTFGTAITLDLSDPSFAGANILCTFTNTAGALPTIAVKVLADEAPGLLSFVFELDSAPLATLVAGFPPLPDTSEMMSVSFATHTIEEFDFEGGPVLDLATAISCKLGGGTGASVGTDPTFGTAIILDLSDASFAGADILCTFRNGPLPRVSAVKILDPVEDPGRFDLRVGPVTVFDVGMGSLDGPQDVVFSVGDMPTVEETIATGGRGGPTLEDYASTVTCSDQNDIMTSLPAGEISVVLPPLLPGADILCAFTNMRVAQE